MVVVTLREPVARDLVRVLQELPLPMLAAVEQVDIIFHPAGRLDPEAVVPERQPIKQ